MNITTWSMTIEDLTRVGNIAMLRTIHRLEVDGILTPEQACAASRRYLMLAAERGTFNKLWDKLWGLTDKGFQLRIVEATPDDDTDD